MWHIYLRVCVCVYKHTLLFYATPLSSYVCSINLNTDFAMRVKETEQSPQMPSFLTPFHPTYHSAYSWADKAQDSSISTPIKSRYRQTSLTTCSSVEFNKYKWADHGARHWGHRGKMWLLSLRSWKSQGSEMHNQITTMADKGKGSTIWEQSTQTSVTVQSNSKSVT